ncbi:hypothetical protein EDC56_3422 [Sinobacterium caligoides]|uniref:Uncharacterized protein n=1 Tax=Sinobacterium caligoides TaxID=933926 RepID=A0A3N2DFW0_9GAMM|nr:hypothetical protein [Sinobacterium caligoides]ROR98686.1 hypothetical protein EDC56_3422 [Sinobacterium caligoides]
MNTQAKTIEGKPFLLVGVIVLTMFLMKNSRSLLISVSLLTAISTYLMW